MIFLCFGRWSCLPPGWIWPHLPSGWMPLHLTIFRLNTFHLRFLSAESSSLSDGLFSGISLQVRKTPLANPSLQLAMDFGATTILQLMVLFVWQCLADTPFRFKNPLFARFFTSVEVLDAVANAACLTFAPSLFEVLKSDTPPPISFFKGLPTDGSKRWGIYLIVLEKRKSRPRIYIGSATNAKISVPFRWNHYDQGIMLPRYIQKSIDDDGYRITHKGLLCWIPLPSAGKVPINRLLFFALEATFAYLFWAMRKSHGDYGMAHICPWDISTLEYDGLCGHCCLDEGIRGEFDLSSEQLEEQAIEKELKRILIHRAGNCNWHYKQMAENYHDYIDKANARVAKSRANNPGRDIKVSAARAAKNIAAKKYHCKPCNLSYTSSNWLRKHKKTAKHARKLKDANSKYKCGPCNLAFSNKSNLNRHRKSEKHALNVAAVQSSLRLD